LALITDEYCALNTEMHRRQAHYGTSAAKHARLVCKVLRKAKARSMLDYGCGKATLRKVVADVVEYRGFDPAIAEYAHAPEPADVVACMDVMEHVEPQFVEAVLAAVIGLAGRAAMFVISCEVGGRILADGLPAHRSVHPPSWWLDRLGAYGRVDIHPPVSPTEELVAVVWKS
jgi:hypothetical protein